MLASAGDDGNVLLWVPSESQPHVAALGNDNMDDKEVWRVKHMCRSQSGAEIYDLAWSPDGVFFITGSMDNIARIYNAQNGMICYCTCLGETDLSRPNDTADSRAQSLCPGRCLGSFKRVRCNPVIGSVGSYLRFENERWAMYSDCTRQIPQNGPTCPPNLL